MGEATVSDVPQIVLLGTPMTLGLARADPERVPGVAGLAAALRHAGLAERLAARDGGDVPAPAGYRPERDPITGVRNLEAVLEHTRALGAALAGPLAAGELPVLLGGDCSILLGALLALRRRGRFGLLHLDGHTDFYSPATSASGQVAAMELWIATGGAPDALAGVDGLRPLTRPGDAALLGHRDHVERLRSGAADPGDHLALALSYEEIRARGAAECARQALRVVTAPALDGFWLHFDADVLDDAAMPAVDNREPGGLAHAEVVTVLRAASLSGRLAGLTVTIFDPSLDPTGALARDLVATLVAGLRS